MQKDFFEEIGGGTATLSRQDWKDQDIGSGDSCSILPGISPAITWDIYGRMFRQYFRKTIFEFPQSFVEGLLKIETTYKSGNFYDVKKFVSENKEVMGVLLEAPEIVRGFFGEGILLSLELQNDPEEGGQELFIKIGNKFSKEEALRRENELFEHWFINKLDAVAGKLNICEERYV